MNVERSNCVLRMKFALLRNRSGGIRATLNLAVRREKYVLYIVVSVRCPEKVCVWKTLVKMFRWINLDQLILWQQELPLKINNGHFDSVVFTNPFKRCQQISKHVHEILAQTSVKDVFNKIVNVKTKTKRRSNKRTQAGTTVQRQRKEKQYNGVFTCITC